MTPIRSQKKKPKSPPAKNSQKEEGRRKKLFAKFPKKIHAEENGISNRQKYPSFISPLTHGKDGVGPGSSHRLFIRVIRNPWFNPFVLFVPFRSEYSCLHLLA